MNGDAINMNYKFMQKWIVLGCSVLCLAVTGCQSARLSTADEQRCNNSVTASTAGMDVKAFGDVPLAIRSEFGRISVGFEARTLMFENQRVFLDTKVRAKLPPSPVAIHVVY